jgi:hypothetical protein
MFSIRVAEVKFASGKRLLPNQFNEMVSLIAHRRAQYE